jgi:hypothetical protein
VTILGRVDIEKLTVTQKVKVSQAFMEPEGSLEYSQIHKNLHMGPKLAQDFPIHTPTQLPQSPVTLSTHLYLDRPKLPDQNFLRFN